ncbi:MAG: hypothetical protein IJG58_00345, partial [Oscillospiraceae bacterium]|nr:hypothetical protein [Oscillospiraceae bacterium]
MIIRLPVKCFLSVSIVSPHPAIGNKRLPVIQALKQGNPRPFLAGGFFNRVSVQGRDAVFVKPCAAGADKRQRNHQKEHNSQAPILSGTALFAAS